MPRGIYIKTLEHKKKISESLKRLGIMPICRGWNKGKKWPPDVMKKISGKNNHNYGKDLSGDKAPNWQGGKRLDSQGYVIIYFPYHPFSNSMKCVRESRLVMEKHLGRYLKITEQVHHINGNKTDNQLSNLMLFKNNTEHLRYHYPCGTNLGKDKVRKGV